MFPTLAISLLTFSAWQILSPQVGTPHLPLFAKLTPTYPLSLGIFPDASPHPVCALIVPYISSSQNLFWLTVIWVIMDYDPSPPLDCRAMGVGLWLGLMDPGGESLHIVGAQEIVVE